MGLNFLPGGPILFAESAGGNYYEQAKQKGATNWEAMQYGAIGGVAEATLNKALGIIPGYKEFFKEGVKVTGKQFAKQAGKEAIEEMAVDPVMGASEKFIFNKDKQWIGEDGIFDWKQMLYDGLAGAAMSGVMTSPALIKNMTSKIENNDLSEQSRGIILSAQQQGRPLNEQEYNFVMGDVMSDTKIKSEYSQELEQNGYKEFKQDIWVRNNGNPQDYDIVFLNGQGKSFMKPLSNNQAASTPKVEADIPGLGRVEVKAQDNDGIVIVTPSGQEATIRNEIVETLGINNVATNNQLPGNTAVTRALPQQTQGKPLTAATNILQPGTNPIQLGDSRKVAPPVLKNKSENSVVNPVQSSEVKNTAQISPTQSETTLGRVNTPSKVNVTQNSNKSDLEGTEILFKDEKGRDNGGKVLKQVDKNLFEVEYESDNGTTYGLVRKNKNRYEFVQSKPTPKEQIPMNDRDMSNVGNRKIKAYQYLHPELKPYIQQEANILLGELQRTQKGDGTASMTRDGEVVSGRTKRQTTQDIAALLDGLQFDGKQGSKYNQIADALNRLINDNGEENQALAKKIEVIIDDRLSKGYYDDITGEFIPANKEYVGIKNQIEGQSKSQGKVDTVGKAKAEIAATMDYKVGDQVTFKLDNPNRPGQTYNAETGKITKIENGNVHITHYGASSYNKSGITEKVIPIKDFEKAVRNHDETMSKDYMGNKPPQFKDIKGGKGIEKASKDAEKAIEDIKKTEAGRDIRSAGGKNNYVKGLKGLAFNRQLIKTGKIDLVGQTINNPWDAATIAQVFRDPRFETFRIIYMKGNKVISHEGVTSRVPNAVMVRTKPTMAEQFQDMKAKMKKLGADSYYILHNHPSGDPTPSIPDFRVTKKYQANIEGFKGHVVINSNKFGLIDEAGNTKVEDLNLEELNMDKLDKFAQHLVEKYGFKNMPEILERENELSEADREKYNKLLDSSFEGYNDELLTPEIEHPLLNREIRGGSDLSRIAKGMQLDKNTGVILYMTSKLKVRAIQEVSLDIFKDAEKAKEYLKNRSVDFGSSTSIIVKGDNSQYDNVIKSFIENDYITDVVTNSGESWRDKGITPNKNQFKDETFFDEPIKGMAVKENVAKTDLTKSAFSAMKNGDNNNNTLNQNYAQSDIKFENISTNSYSGQTNFNLSATVDGKEVGYIEYVDYKGQPSISYIEVSKNHRRKGIGTQLLKKLQSMYPGQEIDWGMTTEDGTALQKAATYTIEDKKLSNKFKELEKLKKQLSELEEKMNKDTDNDNYNEADGELWDKLYWRQRKLEKELEDKKPSKMLIKEDTAQYEVTSTPQFKKWFGESKVVDENGKPLVVYHGTNSEFDVFKTKTSWGFGGAYFSDDKRIAEGFTRNGIVKAAYVSLQNPFIVDAQGKRYDSIARPAEMKGNGNVDTQEIAAYARNNGYDGVIVKNVVEGGLYGRYGDDIIAFEPNQIKSATGNNGDFNPEDASILREEESPYRVYITKVRGGWTIQKIERELKGLTSSRKGIMNKEIRKFDNVDELEKNIFYHGTGGYISGEALKAGSALPKNAFRSGGYDEKYHSISLSKSKNRASNFTGDKHYGTVYTVLLKKDAKVIDRPDLSDSIDLEDELVDLWTQGVDAVKLGNWESEFSEQELAVLNPKAIVLGQGESFPVFHKQKFKNLSKEELQSMLDKAKDAAILREENAEYQVIEKEAIKHFGTTANFKEAGYLTTSGKLLDFSGKRQGGQAGYRSMDHREISDMNDYEGPSMTEFMDMGNIRMQPESDGFELTQPPTKEQTAVLKRYIDRANGEVTVDLGYIGNHNTSPHYMEYSEGTKASKILSDIDRFYEPISENPDIKLRDLIEIYEEKYPKSDIQDFLRENEVPYQANGEVSRKDLENKKAALENQMELISPELQALAKEQLKKYERLLSEMKKKGITKLSRSQVERLIKLAEIGLPQLRKKFNDKVEAEKIRGYKNLKAYKERVERQRQKEAEAKAAREQAQKEKKAERENMAKEKKFLKDVMKNLKYMRPEYQEKVKDLLDGIQVTKPTKATMERIQRMKEYFDREENQDINLPKSVLKSLERLGKTPWADLENEDRLRILTAIQSYVTQNNLKNNLIMKGKRRKLADIIGEALDNIRKRPLKKGVDMNILDLTGERNAAKTMNFIKKIYAVDSLDPEMITQMLDNKVGSVVNDSNGIITKILHKAFNEGSNEALTYEYKAMDELKKLISNSKIKVDSWSTKFQKKAKNIEVFTFKLESGKELRLTKEQRMEIYLNTFNPDSLNGILNGGISIKNNVSKITADELKQITSSLTAEEKMVADKMLELLNREEKGDIKEGLNRVATLLNGYPVATVEGYWPKNTNEFFRKKDASKTMNDYVKQTIEGQGHLKERTGAAVPVIINGAFQTFAESIHLSSSYIGLANHVRNAKTLLEHAEFRSEIYNRYGEEYYRALKKMIENVEGNALDVSNSEKVAMTFLNRITVSIFGANIFIPLKQPIAYINAITEIEGKYLLAALKKRPNEKEIIEHAPFLRNRFEGNSDREVGELGEVGKLRSEFTGKTSLLNKSTALIGVFDKFEIGRIWEAAKLEIKDKRPDLNGEAYWKMVVDRTEEVINRHQPSTGAQNRSAIGRTNNVALRLATTFSSQANKVYNQVIREFLRYNTSQKTAKDKAKLTGNLAAILIIASMLIGGVDALRDWLMGRRKGKGMGKTVVDNMIGNIYYVGPAWQSLSSKMEKGTYAGNDIQNPLTSFTGEVIDAIVKDKEALTDIYTGDKYTTGEKDGEARWKTSLQDAFWDTFNVVLKSKGIPAKNIKNNLSIPGSFIPGTNANQTRKENSVLDQVQPYKAELKAIDAQLDDKFLPKSKEILLKNRKTILTNKIRQVYNENKIEVPSTYKTAAEKKKEELMKKYLKK
jgi:GNAT superfamily N-acetyltransferase/proteasome lid subunit RPN8/RPN11